MMDPLAGWTVAVTAGRRAGEQAELLQRRGADVLLAPAVQADRVDDAVLRAATEAVLADPPDVVVAASAAGMRAWMANAWSWGLGHALLEVLERADVVARSAATAGVLLGEGIRVRWWASGELLVEVLAELRAAGLAGKRVAVQPPGGDIGEFSTALAAAGAEVVVVPVYRVGGSGDAFPVQRLREAAAARALDAVTFTSATAVRQVVAAAPDLACDLRAAGTVTACIGPVTAAAARDAGLGEIVVAAPSRLGSLVNHLGDHMRAKGRSLAFAGVPVRVQGSRLEIDGTGTRLTPRERTLLEAVLAGQGAVVSKRTLSRLAWPEEVTEHAVEVTVNRLRRKLGPAAVALETTNRRGYRLAVSAVA